MIDRLLFFAALGVTAAGVIIAYAIARRHHLKPFVRNLLIFLGLFEIFLGVMHIYIHTNPTTFPAYWNWFFNVRYEFNLGSIFSGAQLMMICIAGVINGLLT